MTWHRLGYKPLSRPMLTRFIRPLRVANNQLYVKWPVLVSINSWKCPCNHPSFFLLHYNKDEFPTYHSPQNLLLNYCRTCEWCLIKWFYYITGWFEHKWARCKYQGQGQVITVHHDDVIKWKHFPRNWPFVRGIHRSPVNSPHKGQCRGALMFFFYPRLNKRLSKQSRRYRAHSDVILMSNCLRYLLVPVLDTCFWCVSPHLRVTSALLSHQSKICINQLTPSLLPLAMPVDGYVCGQ